MSRGVVVRAAVAGLALSSAVRAADLLPPMLGRAQDFAVRRAGAEADARIRLNTSGEGLHRVTGAALTAAGVPAEQLVGGRMRLFNRDREVAVFTTTDALFGADDALVFYAEPWETVYTRTNVYWLGFADGGTHMAARGAAPAADPAVTTAWHTVVHEPDLLYANNYRPNDASLDHWFAGFMTRSNGDYNVFALATPDKDPAAHVASIELTIHGTTSDPAYDPDHATSISLNGVFVGTVATDGVASVVGSVDFGSGILSSTTTVSLLQYAGGWEDLAYLERARLRYRRQLKAVGDRLLFSYPGGTNTCQVRALTTGADLFVADVTDPVHPVRLTGVQTSGSPGAIQAAFRLASTGEMRLAVARLAAMPQPGIERVFFLDLGRATRQADYLMICHYALRGNAYTLLKRRALQGLSVVVAPEPDILNEFGYGIRDPAAIKQFIGYAYHHWAGPPPRYAVIVGDGTYDARGVLGAGTADRVLCRLGPSSWRWTALDNWYVQVSGEDELPDLALGRISARADTTLGYVVQKIEAFENALTNGPTAWRTRATLVADDWDGVNDFKAASVNHVEPPLAARAFNIGRAYLGEAPTAKTNEVTAMIAGRLDGNGSYLLTFFGHGSVDFWTGEQVWTTADVQALGTNTVFPLVGMFTCQTGYYVDPAQECLAEAFLKADRRGAVACLAPSILARQDYSEYVAEGFVNGLFAPGRVRVGEAVQAGLSNLFFHGNAEVEELRAYLLLGDPATVVKWSD